MKSCINVSGKQYFVKENDVIKVDYLIHQFSDINKDSEIKLESILTINSDNVIDLNSNKKVIAKVLNPKQLDKKIIVFKKKRRQGYKRKQGFRKQLTVLKILNIS